MVDLAPSLEILWNLGYINGTDHEKKFFDFFNCVVLGWG